MKMKNPDKLKSLGIGILLVLPLLYMAVCWSIGIVYHRSPSVFGPYKLQVSIDFRDAMKTGERSWQVCDDECKEADIKRKKFMDRGSLGFEGVEYAYEKQPITFIYPAFEFVTFPNKWSIDQMGDGSYRETRFKIINNLFDYDRDGMDVVNSEKPNFTYNSLLIRETKNIVSKVFNTEDLMKWWRYNWLRKFSESGYLRLVGNGMGSPMVSSSSRSRSRFIVGGFDLTFLCDVLGIVGCLILWISWKIKDLRGWFYYAYWVFAYWFGRIGFWSPDFAFKKEGWLAMLNNCFDWIPNEGRLFLGIAIIFSFWITIIMVDTYVRKHFIPRIKRKAEDLMKVDKDKDKRKETAIDSVEFKEVKFDIAKKLQYYAKRPEYFLGVDDNKKDIVIKEQMLALHTHIMGSTGSGKTSLGILPLGHQVIEKGRGACFIDFKGDTVLKKYIQQKAEEKGKKFYYFSIDSTENSITYNPLLSGDIDSKVDRIMSALELIYEGAAGFYSNVQGMVFRELLERMVKEEIEITFSMVKVALKDNSFLAGTDTDPREIKGLLAAISKLAKIEVINSSQLVLSEIIKAGDVVFFALKSQINTQLAEAIGKMLIIDIKAQAAWRNELDPQFFIFIDEFQNIACKHFVDVISKIRSANFCLVLSNQSRGNLMTVSPGFENAIFDNTATKIIFNQENPMDAGFWSDKSGQTTYQERNTLQFDGIGVDGERTMLDGKRSSQGSIFTAKKNYISSNIFLKLPFSKSVVFVKGELARITNHAFLFDRAERDKLLSRPFVYEVSKTEKELVESK